MSNDWKRWAKPVSTDQNEIVPIGTMPMTPPESKFTGARRATTEEQMQPATFAPGTADVYKTAVDQPRPVRQAPVQPYVSEQAPGGAEEALISPLDFPVEAAAMAGAGAKGLVRGAMAGREALYKAVPSLASEVGAVGGQKVAPRLNPLGMYSKMEQTIAEKMGGSATPDQILGMLRDVKPEEIQYSGLNDFLAGKNKVSKQELLDFVKANELPVQEKVLDDVIYDKTHKYSIPEVNKAVEGSSVEDFWEALTIDEEAEKALKKKFPELKNDENWASTVTDSILNDKAIQRTQYRQYTLPGGENYREKLYTLPSVPKKINIDELKNKLSQKGFGRNFEELSESSKQDILNSIKTDLSLTQNPDYHTSHFNEPNILAHTRLNDRVDAEGRKHLFAEEIQSDWHREGSKKGYKTGIEQKNFLRWTKENKGLNLSEDEIKNEFNNKNSDLVKEYHKYQDSAYSDSSSVPDAPMKKTWHEFVSKNLLNDAAKGGYDNISWTTGAQQAERYPGTGEDYKKLIYDERIPQFMGKIGKKYGVKPEKTKLKKAGEVWTMKITPEMRKDIIENGLPMYAMGGMVGYADGGEVEDWRSFAVPVTKTPEENEEILRQYKELQSKYGTPLEQLKGGVEALERGMSLGLSDVARTKLESFLPEEYRTTPEELAGRMQANPITNAAANMLGGAGLIVSTGGVGGLLPEALRTGVGIAPTAARLGAMTAEGGLFGAGNAVTDYALGDPELNAQKVMAHIGLGSALGLGLGAFGESLMALTPKAMALGKAIKEKISPTKELPSMPSAEGNAGEPVIDVSEDFKMPMQPKTKADVEKMINEAKLQGYDETLPAYEIIRAAAEESPTTVPLIEAQLESFGSQDKFKNYKLMRIQQPVIQDLETVQKKALNDAIDATIGNISPTRKPIADAVENGEQTAKVFNDLLKKEQKEAGELVEQAKRWKTEGFDHFQGVVDEMSKKIPDIAKIFKYTPEGEIVYLPYETDLGMTEKTYTNTVKALKALEKNPKDFSKLFNIREGLENGVNLASLDKTVTQIKALKAAMMDYMGNLTDVGPSGLREGFKRYAINEEVRGTLEKNFGIDTREISAHKVGKAEQNITNKIFKDTETLKAAMTILPKEDFKQVLSNYLAQIRKNYTDSEGVFSSKRFDKFLKDKSAVLEMALADDSAALKNLRNYTIQSRLIPDASSINPSGSAETIWRMIGNAKDLGDVTKILEKVVVGKLQKAVENQNFENFLQNRATNATIMSEIEKNVKTVTDKIESGTKAIYSVAPVVSVMEKNYQGYDKHEKKIRKLSADSSAMMNDTKNIGEAFNQVAPNISQGLQNSYVTSVNFLNSKLPKPNRDMPLGYDFKPSVAQKEKFNAYFNAVHNPLIALKQIRMGTLSNETMESLQVVHPKLLEEMRSSVLANMDQAKAKKLPMKVKISLSKFLGMPLDNAMIPQVIASNQATYNMPAPQQAQQGGVKPTLGGLKELNLSNMSKTQTYRDTQNN